MSDTIKGGSEKPAASAPKPNFRLVGLDGVQEFYSLLTGRSYQVSTMTNEQAKQLHELGFKHIELI